MYMYVEMIRGAWLLLCCQALHLLDRTGVVVVMTQHAQDDKLTPFPFPFQIANWLCSLVYMIIVVVWMMLSLFTCCATSSRRRQYQRLPGAEGVPIMREAHQVYGAT